LHVAFVLRIWYIDSTATWPDAEMEERTMGQTKEEYEAQEELDSQRHAMYMILKQETRTRIISAKAKMVGLHASYGALLPPVDNERVQPSILDSIRGCEKAMQAVRIDLDDAQQYFTMLERLAGDSYNKLVDAEIERRKDAEGE
jgi:hypothetical protein